MPVIFKMELGYIIIGFLIGVVIAYILLKKRLKYEENNRKKLAGKYAEKFVPFMKKFPYKSEDSYFLGMPIDYIVFDGLNEGEVKAVRFIEVKSGQSQLTTREKSIKDAVLDKRIEWQMVRI